MIQRKQTLFLLLAVVLGVVSIMSSYHTWWLAVILLVASLADFYTIFIYKRRIRQASLCMVSVFVYLAWYIGLIVWSKQVAPDAADFSLQWSDVLPMISTLLTFMARRAIIADERLVRAADRIR